MASPSPAMLPMLPATFGGIPTKNVDIPVCSVLLACYITLAATHMTIYRRNLARNRKFRPNVLCFGFCMARVTSWSVRIAWACHPTNTTLALVSGIFVAAGVLLLWIVNRVFATRLLGEYHPKFYERQPWSFVMTRLPYIICLCFLPIMITVIVLNNKTTSAHVREVDAIILKVALAYFIAFAVSPFVVPIWIYIIPTERSKEEVFMLQQRNGTGSTITKMLLLVATTTLLVAELCFRVVTTFETYSRANAPWYYSKATFYVVIPGFEIIVLIVYAAARVDKLFYKYGPKEHIPEDASTLELS